jgi:hypothetical protein
LFDSNVKVKLLQTVKTCCNSILANVCHVQEELSGEITLIRYLGIMESKRFAT